MKWGDWLYTVRGEKVYFAGQALPTAAIMARENDILVIKVPGHTAWVSSMSPRIYSPARVFVFRIIEEATENKIGKLERLVDFPARGREKK